MSGRVQAPGGGEGALSRRRVPEALARVLLLAYTQRPPGWTTRRVIERVLAGWHAQCRAARGLPPEKGGAHPPRPGAGRGAGA